MCGVLLLRRIELDLDRLVRFVDLEDLAEGLECLGDDLHLDLALRHRRHLEDAVLIGPGFPGCSAFDELDLGVARHELEDHGCMLDGLAGEIFDHDLQAGRFRREGAGGKRHGCDRNPERHSFKTSHLSWDSVDYLGDVLAARAGVRPNCLFFPSNPADYLLGPRLQSVGRKVPSNIRGENRLSVTNYQ